MGGLCGALASAFRTLAPTFDDFVASVGYSVEDWAVHGADQNALNSKVAPKMKVFEHADFTTMGDDAKTPFRLKSRRHSSKPA